MGRTAPDIWRKGGVGAPDSKKTKTTKKRTKFGHVGKTAPDIWRKRGVGAPNSKKKDT